MFITIFTTACHLCLSWNRLICCMPSHPIYLKSFLILSSNLGLVPSDLFPSCLPPVRISLLMLICHVAFRSLLPQFDNLDDIGWGGQILKLSSWSSFEPSITFCLISSNIFLNALFSSTLKLVFLPQRDRPSFTSTSKNDNIIVLCVSVFIFLDSKWEILDQRMAGVCWI